MSNVDKHRLKQVIARSLPARRIQAIAATAWVMLAGCAVGPDFKRPAAPAGGGYTDQPLPTTVTTHKRRRRGSPGFVTGSDMAGDWWTLFHSRRSTS